MHRTRLEGRLERSARVIACAMVYIVGCSPDPSTEPDVGASDLTERLEDRVFVDRDLGLTLRTPGGWSTASRATLDALRDQSVRLLANGSAAERRERARKLASTRQLLALSRHPLGAPVASNPLLQIIAEKLVPGGDVRTAHDFLFVMSRSLEESALPYRRIGEARTERIGGRPFARQDTELQLPDRRIRQTHFATVVLGHALCVTLTYSRSDERESLMEVVRTLSLER